MKSAYLCTIVLVLLASCESRDVVTGHARVTTLNSPAPAAQPVIRQAAAPAAPAHTTSPVAAPARPTSPQAQAVTSQKQPEQRAQPQPAADPVSTRPAPKARTSQVQPEQRVLTPPANRPIKKKRVLMPGQNRGLMAR